MDINKYICNYLVEYNTSVVVPQLGCLTIVNIPSEIRDGIVTPPSKTVKLDSNISSDDHVLTLYIARKENISVDQAAEGVRNFYQQNFIQKLPGARSVTIEGLGVFSLDESGEIVFVSDENLFKSNFGLDNTYISGKMQEPPVSAPVAPEPPVTIPVAPVSVPVPVQPSQPENKTNMDTQTNSDESLFNTENNPRYRENTTRKEKFERQSPPPSTPAPSRHPQKPVAQKPKAAKAPKEKKEKSGGSYWWLIILLVIAGLGVAGYFLYPKYSPIISAKISPLLEKIPFISSKTPPAVDIAVEEQEETPDPAEETEDDTSNTDIANTLDDATTKKNALNPEGSQQTQPAKPATTTTTSSTSTPIKTSSTSTSTPVSSSSSSSQGSTGRGNYGIIVASLATREDAEAYGRNLSKKHGYSYEVVEAVVNGAKKYRVSVDSFDDWKDWRMYVDKWKNQPGCKDAWAVKK